MVSLKYCVCCLSKTTLQLVHEEIYEERWPWEQPSVAGMIYQCFHIKIDKDTSSNAICSKCIAKVRNALAFREQVISTMRAMDSSKVMLTMKNDENEPLAIYSYSPDTLESINMTCNLETATCDFEDPLEDNNVLAIDQLTFDQVENVKVQVCPQMDGFENTNSIVVFIAGLSKDEATHVIYNNKFEDIGTYRKKVISKKMHKDNNRRLNILEKVCIKYDDDSIASYKCVFCQLLLQTMDELVKHVLHDHKSLYNTKHLMKAGGIRYVYNKRLAPYRLGKNDVICKICNKEFPNTTGLNRHMNDHYALFLCGQCGKSFATEQRLKYHEKRHNPQEAACGHCGMKFKNKGSLYCHQVRKHREDRKWHPCPECSERFDTHNQRVRHLATVHGRTEKKYKCTICPKTFLSYLSLYSHKQKHSKRFNCQDCNRTFYKKLNLVAHQNKAHSIGEPVFVCEICNKSFATQYSKSVHARLHRDTVCMQYACQLCPEMFVDKATLTIHVKNHY